MNTDLEHMQLRLFRRCWIRWKITLEECADLFDRFKNMIWNVNERKIFSISAKVCTVM